MDDETTDPALEALADELRRVLAEETEPAPDAVLDAARGAFTWRLVDAELAELLEEATLVTRSDGADHDGPLAYAVPGVVIDVERTGTVIVGQVGDPDGVPVRATVTVQAVAGADEQPVQLDAAGGFRIDVGVGPVRVVAILPDGRRIVTPWLPT